MHTGDALVNGTAGDDISGHDLAGEETAADGLQPDNLVQADDLLQGQQVLQGIAEGDVYGKQQLTANMPGHEYLQGGKDLHKDAEVRHSILLL